MRTGGWTRRRVLAVGALLFGALAVGCAVLARDALHVRGDLQSAREELAATRVAIGDDDIAAARAHLRQAEAHTASARSASSGSLWRAAGLIPVLGSSFDAVTVSAGVAYTVTNVTLPALIRQGSAADPASLRRGRGLDLGPLRRAAPSLARATHDLQQQEGRLAHLHGPLLPPVRQGIDDLRTQVRELTATVRAASQVADLVPGLLGADGPRRYLVVIQNPAEARGTGGLIGAYAVVSAIDGQLSLDRMGPNGDLASADRLPVDLGSDFVALYGQDPALWSNANLSPYFPYCAQIWLALWQKQFHSRLDGVITIDPIGLANLVGAIGSVTLPDGTRLTKANTARFLTTDVYRRYPNDREAPQRDLLLVGAGRATLTRILAGPRDTRSLVAALSATARARRLLVYSTHAPLEQRLVGTTAGGGLDTGTGPFLAVVVNNGAANKLDVYLERQVTWQLGTCAGTLRGARITIRLTNTAPPSGLPAYAVGEPIRVAPDAPPLPKGSNRVLLTVFTSRGSTLVGADIDDRPIGVRRGREIGLTVTALHVDLGPGGASTVHLQTTEPISAGAPTVLSQPLMLPQETLVLGDSCSTTHGEQ